MRELTDSVSASDASHAYYQQSSMSLFNTSHTVSEYSRCISDSLRVYRLDSEYFGARYCRFTVGTRGSLGDAEIILAIFWDYVLRV